MSGIARLYQATAVDLVLFGAIKFALLEKPERTVLDTIREVLPAFGLEKTISEESAKLIYFRVQSKFLDNNGL